MIFRLRMAELGGWRRFAARIASATRRTLGFAFERPTATLWTLLALTCALVAVGISALAAENLDQWSEAHPQRGASMVVYLGDGVDEPHAKALVGELAKMPGVDRAELVPSEETGKRLQKALGGDAALLEGVDPASLPASVEVTLSPGVRDVVAMSPTVRALRGTAGVEDVVIEDATVDSATSTLGTVRAIAWIAAALFAGLALLVCLSSLRMRLDRTRREREVARLLGASPGFFAIPTALAGAVLGAIAAGLAVGIVSIGLELYGDDLRSAIGQIALAFPPLAECALFIAAGAVLGLVGGGLAGMTRATR